jgi:hypothetical protein
MNFWFFLFIFLVAASSFFFFFHGASVRLWIVTFPWSGFQDMWVFTRCGCKLYAQPPNRSARVLLFVRHRVPNLSGIGGSKSSQVVAGFPFELTAGRKLTPSAKCQCDKAGIQLRDPFCLGLLSLRSATQYSINHQNLQLSEPLPVKKYHVLSNYTWFREKFKIIFENKLFQVYVTCFYHVITCVGFLLFM